MSERIQWGFSKRNSTMTADGVLALAAEWVRDETRRTGFAPGVRDVHYALTSLCPEAGLVYNNNPGTYGSFSRFSAALRREGRFPALSDDSRRVDRQLAYSGGEEVLHEALLDAALDRTIGQPWQTWVAVEKRGLRARVRSWLHDYGLPIIPLGGYTSEVIERHVAREIDADGRPARLLVISDFDPSGLDLPEKFIEHVGRFEQVQRVGLTAAQVDAFRLPTNPAPETDSRLAWFIERTGRDVQVEVNALVSIRPGELERLLLDAVLREWDEDAHADVLDAEWRHRWEVACALEWFRQQTEFNGMKLRSA